MDDQWEELTPEEKHEALHLAIVLHLNRLPPEDRKLPQRQMTRDERLKWFVEAVERHLGQVKFIRPKRETNLGHSVSNGPNSPGPKT